MLHIDTRAPPLAQTIWELAAEERRRRRPSPLARLATAAIAVEAPSGAPPPKPTSKPAGTTKVGWIEDVLHHQRGVIAALPTIADAPARTIALDRTRACGHASFWMTSYATEALQSKSVSALAPMRGANATTRAFAVATLQTGVPAFVPDGDTYGHKPGNTDALIDAGIRLEMHRTRPGDEPHQQGSSAKELALLCDAAERGIAPCVLAAFYAQGATDFQRWRAYKRPTMPVAAECLEPREPEAVHSVVVASQLSTFTLDDLMHEYRTATLSSRKTHLRRVLTQVCAPVFAKLRELSAVHAGYGMFKANVSPETVVFCPELVPDGATWRLNGFGYQPVSAKHIDGMPKLTSFSPAYTTQVRERSHSVDTAYAAHCLLLLAYTRARHGADVADVLWQHALGEGDPSGFVAAARRVKSSGTNAPNFLAWLASNFELQHVHEVVGDLDRCLIKKGLIGSDGQLSAELTGPCFSKLVALVTGSACADTHIFLRATSESAASDAVEAEQLAALEAVKRRRLARVAAAAE
jgi:hypothetical protein